MNTLRPLPLIALAVVATHAAPPEAYLKRWRDPALQHRIEQNIEEHRKGDAMLEIVDARGRPVSGAVVSVRQTGHEFLFGANAPWLAEPTPSEPASPP